MTSGCLLCDNASHDRFTLNSMVKILQSVTSALNAKAIEEKQNSANAEVLQDKLNELKAETDSLRVGKIQAEKRSELYKERFLNAQKTIQQLHEKNVELSNSQKKIASRPPSRFLFESPDVSRSRIIRNTNERILAPDTCGFDLMEMNSTRSECVSSDEEDFQEPQSRKSPKGTPKPVQNVKKMTIESYFAVPKCPVKKVKSNITVDLDETRLDQHDSMDLSIASTSNDTKEVEEVNSIPPSPVLSGSRRGHFLKKAAVWQNQSPSIPERNNEVPPHNKTVDPEETFISEKTKSNAACQHVSSTRKDSQLAFNTSLEELFDKTYGDLETTSMLFAETCDDTEDDAFDEDDHFLLEDTPGLSDATPSPPHQISDPKPQRSRFEDSFDAPPRKASVHRPNEVVRKKDEREKLEGRSCPQCESYYKDLPVAQRRNVLKNVCRHKHVKTPPSTPEHFWEVDMPSTAECRRRGYITDGTREIETSKSDAQTFRRKRPLQPYNCN